MKFLGIDYGLKRIGIAISDEMHSFAFPKAIIPNDKHMFEKIIEILENENIKNIVVGESTDFSGKLNKISKKIETFISQFDAGYKIYKQKEFLTSSTARMTGKTKGNFGQSGAHSRIKQEKSLPVDDTAAALILQRFLDKYNHGNTRRI